MQAPTTYPVPAAGQAWLAHLRPSAFLALSIALHAALFGALGWANVTGAARSELQRRQRLVDAGARLTQAARLEQRVHDMARIKSLLEQSSGGARPQDEVRFSGHPATADRLLNQARDLARAIDKIERDIEAERLAVLLRIPKDAALQRLARPTTPTGPLAPPRPPRPAAAAAAEPARPINAANSAVNRPAKAIEQLEARARAALARRRQQLEQQRDGVRVAAGGQAHAAGNGTDPGRQAGTGSGRDSGKDNGKDSGTDGARQSVGGNGEGQGIAGGADRAQVLRQIDAFLNPDLPDKQTQAYGARGMQDIFDHGAGAIPEPGAAAIVKGAGRMIGPGAPYATRVFVDSWYLIGPFEGRHGAGLFANPRHPPEDGVVLDAVYPGKDGRLLRWDYVDMASYPLKPPDEAEDAVYYGYTELMMDKDEDLTIWVGADDDARLWLNDRLVWQGGNTGKEWFFSQVYATANHYVRDYNLSEGKRLAHFRKGRNKLFFKLSNGPTRLFFSLVLTK